MKKKKKEKKKKKKTKEEEEEGEDKRRGRRRRKEMKFLASGKNHRSLSFYFRAGVTTIRSITTETCRVIWNVLQPLVMPTPDGNRWRQIALEFHERFDFPLCLEAIDGKHIRIKKPHRSGSKYYNYKGYCSIVLFAVSDANGKFVIVDVVFYGGNSDGGVFNRSTFGKKLLAEKLAIPENDFIPGTDINIPYTFVADEAFPLRENIIKPFAHHQLTHDKQISNYRLSRARDSVECSFGRIAQMWRILLRQIDAQPVAATNIVKSITALHNFIVENEPHRLVTTAQDVQQDQGQSRGPVNYQNLQRRRQRATKCALQIRE
ncbi:protein antagonist of like heterochromatin protein 1 [Plakobranchus ocellatus]|uniref:Protein antagonist of like heterochromatin protein 1 n=1 Tax=Plakobranchus ocellatus TaxID=259542 RepID=A0AAV4DH74_9GAST|nr:protein antagonist of like heterochromatin protein 1 [Plakobranchus ocellatus]